MLELLVDYLTNFAYFIVPTILDISIMRFVLFDVVEDKYERRIMTILIICVNAFRVYNNTAEVFFKLIFPEFYNVYFFTYVVIGIKYVADKIIKYYKS